MYNMRCQCLPRGWRESSRQCCAHVRRSVALKRRAPPAGVPYQDLKPVDILCVRLKMGRRRNREAPAASTALGCARARSACSRLRGRAGASVAAFSPYEALGQARPGQERLRLRKQRPRGRAIVASTWPPRHEASSSRLGRRRLRPAAGRHL